MEARDSEFAPVDKWGSDMNKSRLSNTAIDTDFQNVTRQSAEARYLHRLHCVKLIDAGCEPGEVGRWFERPTRTVERWVRQYAEHGEAGLVDKPRKGRPCTVSDALHETLKCDVRQRPAELDLPAKSWTGVLLREWLSCNYGVDLSLRQSQRLLKRLQETEQAPPPVMLRAVSA